MSFFHVTSRNDLDHFPDNKYLEIYKRQLSELPLPDNTAEKIKQQLDNSKLTFYCKCGCHSFNVESNNSSNSDKLQDGFGLFKEIAFRTNKNEELNVMLFIDNGHLYQVTVFYGVGNVNPIPEDIEIMGIEGIW